MPADSIIHIRSMHPLDDHYGLGCLGAASGAVAIHNAATKWNKALLDNAAAAVGGLGVRGQRKWHLVGRAISGKLKEELASKHSKARAMPGGRCCLKAGLRWQAMALTPAEMDFAGLKEAAAREIALGFRGAAGAAWAAG